MGTYAFMEFVPQQRLFKLTVALVIVGVKAKVLIN
jgi:hypothetical protein